jgi:ribonuclease HI
LLAIVEATRLLLDRKQGRQEERAQITSSSRYAVYAYSSSFSKWKRAGWKGPRGRAIPLANLWSTLDRLLTDSSNKGLSITFTFAPTKHRLEGSRRALALAREAARNLL